MNKIEELRKTKGLTYENLSSETKLTSVYIWNLAKGKRVNPTLEVMKKIAKALDTTVQELFFSEEV